MAARRATASLRVSRFSRASFARSELAELLRSTRDFCRLGVLVAAKEAAPFQKSIQIKVKAAMMRLGIILAVSFQVKRVIVERLSLREFSKRLETTRLLSSFVLRKRKRTATG